jgi:tetratricopeptide (TPR) repeat protein
MIIARSAFVRAAVLTALVAASAGAQQTLGRGEKPGPRFMVPLLRSTERGLSVDAADAIRERMMSDFRMRDLWIVPTSDISGALEQSGYPTNEALNATDTRSLAGVTRADEYVEGTVTKTATGYRIDATLKLVRPDVMVQPLPAIEAPKLDKAAERLSEEIARARKQIEPARKCMMQLTQRTYAVGLREAQAGIKAYAPATMPRLCILEIDNAQKAPPDSIISHAEALLGIDPYNRRALALVADAYHAVGKQDRYIATLLTLLEADSTNLRLVQTVVTSLAAAGQPEKARTLIDAAVRRNPTEAGLKVLQWRVHLAVRDFASAARIGEDVAANDSASADSTFVASLVGAHIAAGDTAGARRALTRGTARFPRNTRLLLMLAQLQRQQGDVAQSVATLDRVVGIDPNIDGVWLQLARGQVEINAPADSIFYSLRRAKAAGDSASIVAGVAVSVANSILRRGSAERSIDLVRQAISVASWADSTAESDNAKFVTGLAYVSLGQMLLPPTRESPTCEDTREAVRVLTQAAILVPRGGRPFPQQTAQAMQALQALAPYADRVQRSTCR